MTTWDPEQYLTFADLRMRPALDLIGRIPEDSPSQVWDLGCGTGAVTAVLAARWPEAAVHGLDSSPQMLERAAENSGIEWVSGTIEEWRPAAPIDVIFSNAALHWLGDHERLFPSLVGFLSDEGILAVQMPRNHGEASHRVLFETARSRRWKTRLAHLVRANPVATPEEYHEMLSPLAGAVDVWETIYQQALAGEDAVAQWTRGSVIRPYLDALGSDAADFFAEYAEALRPHYPARADGTTLFSFRRLFIVAQR